MNVKTRLIQRWGLLSSGVVALVGLTGCNTAHSPSPAIPPAVSTASASTGAIALSAPFTLYAGGGTVPLNLPQNLNAQTTWSLSSPLGELSGQGRKGQYTPPKTVAQKSTVILLLKEPASAGAKQYTLALVILPSVLKAQAVAAGPDGMTLCASEGEHCSVTGTQAVAYGSGNSFVYQKITDGVDCNNLVFGDPTPGVAKACYSGDSSILDKNAPQGYSYCAAEGEQCNVTGVIQTAFGTNTQFAYQLQKQTFLCANNTYGTDPLPGQKKSCYVKNDAPEGYEFCSLENQTCDFAGAQKIAYGANDHFVYLTQLDSTACNNTVFGEPIIGIAKACYRPIVSMTDFDGSQSGSSDDLSDNELIPADEITASIDKQSVALTAFVGSEIILNGDMSNGNELIYHWDFGDGQKIDMDSESRGDTFHRYDQPGYYTVTLRIIDKPTNTIRVDEVKISILPDISEMPNHLMIRDGESLKFDVGYPRDDMRYLWEFSDGYTIESPSFSRSFSKEGFTDYTLSIYNTNSNQLIESDTGKVNHIFTKPEAKIEVDNISGAYVQFDASKSKNADSQAIYNWDFGDGELSEGIKVSHIFPNMGNYVTTLIIKNKNGKQSKARYLLNIFQVDQDVILNTKTEINLPENLTPPSFLINNTKIDSYISIIPDSQNYSELSSNLGITTSRKIGKQQLAGASQVKYIFPYVIPDSVKSIKMQYDINNLYDYIDPNYTKFMSSNTKFYSVDDALTSFGDTSSFKENAIGNAFKFKDCKTIGDTPACMSAIANESVFQQQPLFSGYNLATLFAASHHTAVYPVFSGLHVPQVVLSVLPDSQLEDISSQLYAYISASGKKEFYIQSLVPESKLIRTNGVTYVPLILPVYAVDKDGLWLKHLTGRFNGHFADSRIFSEAYDGIMVNGIASMQLYIPLEFFERSKNTSFDLSHLIITANHEGCGIENATKNQETLLQLQISGCANIATSSEVPLGIKEIAFTPQKFQALDVLSDVGEIISDPASTSTYVLNYWFNNIEWPKFQKDMINYDSDSSRNINMILPFVDPAMLLISEGYKHHLGITADYNNILEGLIGLIVDTTTMGEGHMIAVEAKRLGIVGLPEIKSAEKAFVESNIKKDSKGFITAVRESHSFLFDKNGKIIDSGRKLTLNEKSTLENSIAIARESGLNSLDSLNKYSLAYKDLQNIANFNKLPLLSRMSIAKYGMFAPKLAKSAANCGEKCVTTLNRFNTFLKGSKISGFRGSQELENESLSLETRNTQQGFKETEADKVEESVWRTQCKLRPGNSFDDTTLVMTAIGLRPINTLQKGEEVLAYNEATAANGYYPITAVMHHMDDQITTLRLQGANGNSETINTTPEHPFYVTQQQGSSVRPSPIGHEGLNSHWVGAGHLKIGDKLKLADGREGSVLNVATQAKTQEMFNLTVAQAHTFYVGGNGWLVHNVANDWCDKAYLEALELTHSTNSYVVKRANQLTKMLKVQNRIGAAELPGGLAGAIEHEAITGEYLSNSGHFLKGEAAAERLKIFIGTTKGSFSIPAEDKQKLINIAEEQLEAIEKALALPRVPRKI